MEYGLIGEKLGHSYSPQIHAQLADYRYELKAMPPEALAAFAEEELAPLFRHCPAGMLDMPEGEDLQDLLDEARYLCLDMLEGK